jgi:hypothetical protein
MKKPSLGKSVVVLAILACIAVGLLIPTSPFEGTPAKIAKTKVQFGQWAIALGAFKQEYGYYPRIDTAISGTTSDNKINTGHFAAKLAAKSLNGVPLPAGIKHLRFYDFSSNELFGTPPQLHDAYGNTDIAVLIDKNGDDIINTQDVPAPPSVKAKGGGTFAPTAEELGLTKGIRAGVLFYSAGQGNLADKKILIEDAILSWNLEK